jgi:hypothetical protein
VLDKKQLRVATALFAAGASDVELRLPNDELYARIAGRVISLSGEPLESVRVVLKRAFDGVQAFEGFTSIATTTDAAGRFAFAHVSRAVNAVHVDGDELGLQGFQKAIGPQDDVEALELAAPTSVHVQVVAEGPAVSFDSVAVLDAQGERLDLSLQHGNSAYALQDINLDGGRTETFSVSELAHTLVLYEDKVEVGRVPLKLSRSTLNTIRP